ncbi:SPOR domain-containing protein [Bowmanella yangjiangensis]|uniref:SPOR domain-containing protein n=1 Tax=Bowmanella yangjiangensis TaxID=2811230 RepID=A0ABS3CW21_9ALTE|nr:hypothetical protein [Bowmanella yangjiangensis]MBN7821318.1 hypothetical protein [Bowmanella yangjiangensis]
MLPLLILTVSACSTLDNGITYSTESLSLPDEAISSDEVRQYVQEWREAKAGIQRLNDLEADLAVLIAEVNRASDLQESPPIYRGDQQEEVLMAPAPMQESQVKNEPIKLSNASISDFSSTNETNQSTTAGTVYGLRIAAFLKPQSAKFGWYLIQQRDGKILTGLSAKLLKAEHPRQTLYNLNVGPFSNVPDAEHLCEKLKPRQYVCEVGEFSGEELL